MKKFLPILTLLVISFFISVPEAQAWGEPKFVYDKCKAYINSENQKQSETYKTFYFFAPFTGYEKTPVMYLLIYDGDKQEVKALQLALTNDGDQVLWNSKPTTFSYGQLDVYNISGETYILGDMGDGRGKVGIRYLSAYRDPIDRGPVSSYKGLFEGAKKPMISPVSNLSLLDYTFKSFM